MRVHQSRPRPAAEVRRKCADALLVDVDEHDVVACGRRIRRGAHAPVVRLQLDGLDERKPAGPERDQRRAESDGECDEKLAQAGERVAEGSSLQLSFSGYDVRLGRPESSHDRSDRLSLSGPPRTGRRRHGRGVPCRGHEARTPGRAQGAGARFRPRPRSPRPLRARSARRRRAQPPRHRHDPLRRGAPGRALPHDGAGGRPDAFRVHPAGRDDARPAAQDRHSAHRRRRHGAPSGHHAPRPQAGQRDGRPRRARQGARLRPGEATAAGLVPGRDRARSRRRMPRRKARSSVPSPTWRPSRPKASPSIRARTSSRSASCCSRWRPASVRSRATRTSRCCRRCSRTRRRSSPICRSDLPRDLGRIVKRCLAKDPEERYQSGEGSSQRSEGAQGRQRQRGDREAGSHRDAGVRRFRAGHGSGRNRGAAARKPLDLDRHRRRRGARGRGVRGPVGIASAEARA